MSEEVRPKSDKALREEEILAFWKENRIFEKTLEKKAPKGDMFFYDGPPFATGLPHYGHILAGTIKDVIPRFETMRGFRVVRRWGWDCHGLPIENLIEQELGLKNKKDIEILGIEKFNEAARASVFRYDKEWREIVPRSGRWVDMDDQYNTMSPQYTESVWWSFSELYKKGLAYEGFKSMHLCPHCETTLANFEVGLGYKDISDISVYVKFELIDEPGTFLLAWTTTPWTLPGNIALAIGPDIEYVKIHDSYIEGSGVEPLGSKTPEPAIKKDFFYIVASDLYERNKIDWIKKCLIRNQHPATEKFLGKKLLGRRYKPLFDYYTNTKLENKENGWKVYGADFVTTEDGTGIVHIAPGFGEDDLALSQKEKLPFIQHVDRSGVFKKEVTDFAGQSVKPKSEDEKTRLSADIAIIRYLQEHGNYFAKEKITHSYPHCWRCDTPLLNYASASWFVGVTKYKDLFIKENKKVTWIPEEIRDGRFGKWLEGARDWAISRSRYWGAPIPVWVCNKCETKTVIGSLEELKDKTKSTNTYIVMRHGESESNISGILNSDNSIPKPLTEIGREQARETAKKLKGKIDLIITSPLVRTKETANIVAEITGIKEVIVDESIQEVQAGEFNKKPDSDYQHFASLVERFEKTPRQGENLTQIKQRMGDFIHRIDSAHKGKRILVITHEYPAWLLFSAVLGLTPKQAVEFKGSGSFIGTAETKELVFSSTPHNRNYELDMHRPYIDNFTFSCTCGGDMKRIPDLFDTWYESGSMPYASHHYPFDKTYFDPAKNKRFPADFIAEGVDQTRGWFYSLLMLSTALFNKAPYKRVIVNGTVLAEDGQKMSKRLKNYPDVREILNRYGADAMRYYMISSPVVHGEDFSFSEKGLDDVVKKLILRLLNVYSFYELYTEGEEASSKSPNVLDTWILSRLAETIEEITKGLSAYTLDSASRPTLSFVDDLSVWYIRRSRDRFKGEDQTDKKNALATTRFVLQEFSKVIAPFMPFIAEDLHQKVKGEKGKESVHLEDWPKAGKKDTKLIDSMSKVRDVVSLSLEARAKASIKVRQPLATLSVSDASLKGKEELLALIRDEVNVKSIVFDTEQALKVSLDTAIDENLKEEGFARDFIRALQEGRKSLGLQPRDRISLVVDTTQKIFIDRFQEEIKRVAGITDISFSDSLSPTHFDGVERSFSYNIKRS